MTLPIASDTVSALTTESLIVTLALLPPHLTLRSSQEHFLNSSRYIYKPSFVVELPDPGRRPALLHPSGSALSIQAAAFSKMEKDRGSHGLRRAPQQPSSSKRVDDEDDACFASRFCAQKCTPSVFSVGPWLAMLQYVGAPPFGEDVYRLPLSVSLAMHQEAYRLESLSVALESQGEKANKELEYVLAVRVVRLQKWDLHLEAQLADPTGTVCATIGNPILATFCSVLSVGSVLLLRNAPLVSLTNTFPPHFARQHPVSMFRLIIRLEHVQQVFPPETSIAVCVPGGLRLCARSARASYIPHALVSQVSSRFEYSSTKRVPVTTMKKKENPGKSTDIRRFYNRAASMKRRRT